MTGGGRKTPTTPILLVEHRAGWLVIRISTMPVRGGRTEIATRPLPLVNAALLRPGPLTRIRTPLTPRFFSVTITLTTSALADRQRPRLNLERRAARDGRCDRPAHEGGRRGPVVRRVRLGLIADDRGGVQQHTGLGRPHDDRDRRPAAAQDLRRGCSARRDRRCTCPGWSPRRGRSSPAGSASATRTFVALSGPRFRTVSV